MILSNSILIPVWGIAFLVGTNFRILFFAVPNVITSVAFMPPIPPFSFLTHRNHNSHLSYILIHYIVEHYICRDYLYYNMSTTNQTNQNKKRAMMKAVTCEFASNNDETQSKTLTGNNTEPSSPFGNSSNKNNPFNDSYFSESGLIDKSLLLEDWQKEELEQFHEQEIASRQCAEDEEWMYKQNPRMNY